MRVSNSGRSSWSGCLDHAQAGCTGLSECDIGVRGHQDLPRRLACILRLGLIGFELRNRTNDPVWLKPMLDFVDQDDSPFSNSRFLDRQGGESSGA